MIMEIVVGDVDIFQEKYVWINEALTPCLINFFKNREKLIEKN
jgi:hypothetical protein